MKKYLPYILLSIAIIVILHLWEQKQNQRMSLESVINQKTSEFKIRTTSDSLRIASQDAAHLASFNEVSKYYGREMNAVKEELGLQGKKMDKMQSLVRASFLVSTHGKVKTIIEKHYTADSVDNMQGSALFEDSHFKVGVFMNKDTTIFNPVQYKATFTAVGFVKKRLLRKDKFYVNAYLDDKNANITGLTNFEVKEFKDKRFSVGPFVGYDVINNRPSAGIAVSYSLFKF